jgi:hypothetical protein
MSGYVAGDGVLGLVLLSWVPVVRYRYARTLSSSWWLGVQAAATGLATFLGTREAREDAFRTV